LVESYLLCGGDPEAMTDWLMETLMAETVDRLRDAQPLVIDGVTFSPDQIVNYQVGLMVQEVIAGIEGHGETRH